jgi:hypothetical protein
VEAAEAGVAVTVLASAANERYGYHLLSMLGSVQRNSDVFERIVVYDLGLNREQRRLLDAIRGVEARTVPPFSPHWAQAFTWKPWIWTHLDTESVFYLDAGAMVLRSLAPLLALVEQRGFWVVGQGFPVSSLVPRDYLEPDLVELASERTSIAAGIIGFETRGRFWDEVVLPTYEDCLAGRNLGYSPHEVERLNFGMGYEENPPLRDAEHFRHDQTVLNTHFLRAFPDVEIADVYEFAGWQTPHDHPRQVIWNHRRRGDYRYLAAARYEPHARVAAHRVAFRLRASLWRRRNARYFQPSAYARKLRSAVAGRPST